MDLAAADDFSRHSLEDLREHGILGRGYTGYYGLAEAFMRRAAALDCYDDPVFAALAVWAVLEGNDFNLDEVRYEDLLCHTKPMADDAIIRIYSKCVDQGDFFDGFLRVCGETKILDSWFLSESFMFEVWAGSIRARWYIAPSGQASVKPYQSRFKKLVKSLDARGLRWTEKYLEGDLGWGQREMYWIDDENKEGKR